MDLLGVFFALLGLVYLLGLPIGVIMLISVTAGLRRRLEALEADARAAPRQQAAPPAPRAAPQAGPEPQTQAEAPAAPEPAPEPAPAKPARDYEGELVGGWFVWIAAAALALGGVFLVREAIQQGWLTPWMRVAGGAALGVALIAVGEWLRRGDLAGDPERKPFQAPAALAVGGVSALMASVLAARHLYDLVDPGVGFAVMVAISVLAMGLGWLHGPVLAGAGLLGGYLTPFLVGGEPHGAGWLFAYVLVLTAACYGVERLKQWGWVAWSATAAAGIWGVVLIHGFDAAAQRVETALSVALFAPALAAIAAMLPGYGVRLISDEPSTALLSLARRRLVSTTALLAAAAFALAAALLLLAAILTEQILMASLGFAALSAFGFLALQRIGVLDECAAIAVLAASAALLLTGPALGRWTPRLDTTDPWLTPLLFVTAILAALAMAAADWRTRRGERTLYWAAVGAFGPAALFFGLYLGRWDVFAPPQWAVGAAALAAAQTAQAGRLRGGPVAVFALAAFASLAGGAGIVLSGAPLSLAFAVLMAAAALMDRRLDLPALAWASAGAAMLLGARLLVWPGVSHALDMTRADLALAYLPAAAGAALAAWVLGRDAAAHPARLAARVATESAALVFLGAYLSILARRAFLPDAAAPELAEISAAELGLYIWVWGSAALAQLYRARLGGFMRRPRLALAALAGLGSGLTLLALAGPFNPVFTGAPVGDRPLLDQLGFAYLGGAALLAVGALMLARDPWPRQTRAMGLAAGAAGLLYLLLEVRRLWRGPDLSGPGVETGELYSYTLALLSASVATTLAGALTKPRGVAQATRRVGLALAAVTVGKAFLIDLRGLDGLWLAGSFLALGLCLVGLAWLYRRLEPSAGDAAAGDAIASPSPAPRPDS